MYTNECLYKDVYTIIEMMAPEMKNRINKNFINFLKENQDKEFEGTINKKIPIKNQELREEVKLMLSLIYISYFCTEEKKKEILELESYNVNEFYNRDIFKDLKEKSKKNIQADQEKENTLEITEYKDNFLNRIFRKIRSIFFNENK